MARRRFGQHFLEPVWVRKVVDVIAPAPGQAFLEIGPGAGALTLALAERGASIVAVEIDRDLAEDLSRRVPPNVKIVAGDFLRADIARLIADLPASSDRRAKVRVVGNLPYNVASPIMFKLVAAQRQHAPFSDATLMLQREVAVRVTAGPGSKDYGVLSIMVQTMAAATLVLALPPGAFRPVPKVRSAVVRLDFGRPPVEIADYPSFAALVHALFTHRRKTLQNALKPFAATCGLEASAVLARAGLDPRRRPETLQLTELTRLAAILAGLETRD